MEQATQEQFTQKLRQKALDAQFDLPTWFKVEDMVRETLAEVVIPATQESKLEATDQTLYTMADLKRICGDRNIAYVNPVYLCRAVYGSSVTECDIQKIVRSISKASMRKVHLHAFMAALRKDTNIKAHKRLDYHAACELLDVSNYCLYRNLARFNVESAERDKGKYRTWTLDDVVYVASCRRLVSAKETYNGGAA